MGNRSAKQQRRRERAEGLYAACLLVNEMPRTRAVFSIDRPSRESPTRELVFNDEYKSRVGDFYISICTGENSKGTPPGRKARKRFVRSYCSWLRKQVTKHEKHDGD